jgi:hypothetical protein
VRRNGGVTAGYQFTSPDTVIVATVHVTAAGPSGSLLPSLDRESRSAEREAAVALERSIAQVHRFYPTAKVIVPRDVFLVRGGGLRSGRGVTMRYDELLGGSVQPVDLDIAVLCCTADGALYEYRFRHAASVSADAAAAAFMEALPWAKIAPVPSATADQ